jgi:hypothetical protein
MKASIITSRLGMKPPRKTWVYKPPRPKKPQVPDDIKHEVEAKARELIDTLLKPEYIHPAPAGSNLNYIVDIYSRWNRNYFYFCSKYACPGPNAISPFFETKFARLEYMASGCFDISYMRYTGQWIEIGVGLTLNGCLDLIEKAAWFHP